MHGSLADTSEAEAYAMTSPPIPATDNSPLPGWTITMTPVDSATTSTIVTFGGTFSTATAIEGYVKFTHGAATDSVTVTLTKQ